MIITKQEKSDNSEWEKVIADAESEIRASRARISQLKASIRTFRAKMQAGEPLPEGLERFRASTQN